MSTSVDKIKEAVLSRFQLTKNGQLLTLLNEGLPLIRAKKLTLLAFAKRVDKFDSVLSQEIEAIQEMAKCHAIASKFGGKPVFGKQNIPKGYEKDYYFSHTLSTGVEVYIYNED